MPEGFEACGTRVFENRNGWRYREGSQEVGEVFLDLAYGTEAKNPALHKIGSSGDTLFIRTYTLMHTLLRHHSSIRDRGWRRYLHQIASIRSSAN